ncbi:hypothetical protein SV7mr_37720 [Stieleria bergensis]|uniref:Uncharacterized protein n=1 Tax=Stieleria bergensis TaxID=2528025 RepID=A0A517SYL6_9BACT|nr:hypothetical protein SV7mr_37720 [Planctomycetes bacterium SV_7m_r]
MRSRSQSKRIEGKLRARCASIFFPTLTIDVAPQDSRGSGSSSIASMQSELRPIHRDVRRRSREGNLNLTNGLQIHLLELPKHPHQAIIK